MSIDVISTNIEIVLQDGRLVALKTDAVEDPGGGVGGDSRSLELGDVQRALAAMSLTSITFGDFLVVMRSDFDVNIYGEPYHAITLLYNVDTRQYLARMWNQTVLRGKVTELVELEDVCDRHFRMRRMCLGLFEDQGDHGGRGFLLSQTPIPRRISRSCLGDLSESDEEGVHTCRECLKLEVAAEAVIEVENARRGQKRRKADSSRDQSEVEEDEPLEKKPVLELVREVDVSKTRTKKTRTRVRKGPVKVQEASIKAEMDDIKIDSGDLVVDSGDIKVDRVDIKAGRDDTKADSIDNKADSIDNKADSDGNKKGRSERYPCPYCDKKYESWLGLSYHKKQKHNWGVFRCPTCNLRANFVSDLVEHMVESRHEEENSDVRCPTCRSHFGMSDMESHYGECVRGRIKSQKEGGQRVCETCGKVLKNSKCYYNHIKIHLRSGVTDSDRRDKKLYFYCDRCPKRFTDKTSVREHVRVIHEGIRTTNACSLCPMTFAYRQGLNKHFNRHHSTDQRYQCKECDRRFGNAMELRNHMHKHDVARLECRYCRKMLKTELSLAAHEMEHRGEKPHVCDVCGKGFTLPSTLIGHKKQVHKILTPRMKPLEKRVRRKTEKNDEAKDTE